MDVEGKYGNQVDGVEWILKEATSIWTGPQTNQVLQSEPGDTYELHNLEIGVLTDDIIHIFTATHFLTPGEEQIGWLTKLCDIGLELRQGADC